MKLNLNRPFIITTLLAVVLAACGAAPSESWSGVAVASDENTIYVTQATHLYALAPGGTKKWQFPADNTDMGKFYSDPVIAGDTIVLTSYNKSVYGLDLNGIQKWVFSGSQDRLMAPATVYEDTIYVGSADNNLYALNMDGTLKWQFTTKNSIWGAPLPLDEMLIVPSMDHNLYAIDAATGSQIWVAPLNGAVAGSPALSEDSETVFVGTLNDTLYAIDPASGNVKWEVTAKGWVWSTPLVDGDTLYFGDLRGGLFSVDTSNGDINWNVQIEGIIRATPVLINESLIVVTDAGKVFSIDPASGAKSWEIELDTQNADRLLANPVVVRDVVIIVPISAAELVYALNPSNGSIVWTFKP
jgi:eukaryotic-like serine/threonine-protein kinase